jgi:hypothetical protein
MELIYDGRSDFHKFWDAIQNAEITFTMINIETGVTKVANAPAYIKLRENTSCIEEYVICYDWKKRDTKEKGMYKGIFSINFSGDIKSDNLTYPVGELIMPIREQLTIIIQ